VPGYSVDIEQAEALAGYLRATGRIAPEENPHIRVLAGGVSNRTVLVQRINGESWVVKQALPKLRVAVDWFCPPHRAAREALGMRWLNAIAPESTTRLVFEDSANYLFAMEAVPQPHENWKAMLLSGRVEPDHARQFGALLATIHRSGYEQRGHLPPEFNDASYFEALRIEPYYAYTAAQVPSAAAFLNELIRRTAERRITVVHGDYSPKNILAHEGRLILLDHEVIHVGDPAFDIGFSMTHLISKARHLPKHRDALIDAALTYWRTYSQAMSGAGIVEEDACVAHILGCMLARAAGRSPLEYLDDDEKREQIYAVLANIRSAPNSVTVAIVNLAKR
jgi:aminoglycoside phosphotransferase (APT) family kinase protein